MATNDLKQSFSNFQFEYDGYCENCRLLLTLAYTQCLYFIGCLWSCLHS